MHYDSRGNPKHPLDECVPGKCWTDEPVASKPESGACDECLNMGVLRCPHPALLPGKHDTHGRGDVSGPHESDCACRGSADEAECSKAGCGFCRVTKVFWISWYDVPTGPPGKWDERVTSWCTGYRGMDEVRTARVVAATEAEAWAATDVMFPGASASERRFTEEKEAGWWPPEDRFPRPRVGRRKKK